MRASLRVVVLAAVVAACGDNNLHGDTPPDGDVTPPDGVVRAVDTVAPAEVKAGDTIAVTCLLTENDVQTMVTGMITVTDDTFVEHNGAAIVARKVGSVQVACSLPGLALVDDTPATVQIIAGDPATITTTITPDPVTAGETATATCEVFDSSGNPITDVTPTLSITPTDPGTTITDLTAVLTRAGLYTGECALPGITGNSAQFDVVPALPAALVLGQLPTDPVHPVNGLVTITHVVTDRFGNEIPTANVGLDSTGITGAGPIETAPPDAFRYKAEGRYRVTGGVTDPTDGDVPVTAELEVVINSTGPKIQCVNDASMINLTPGSTLTINGDANDVNGVASLAVNGTPVTLGAGNSFSAPIVTRFGLNFVDVTAVDDFGATTSKVCTFLVSNRWASPTALNTDGLSLKLTQAAVDDTNRSGAVNSFADLLYTIVNSAGLKTTLHDAMLAANPLKTSSCDSQVCVPFVGCACVYSSEIEYIDSSIPGANTVALTLVDGGIQAKAHIPNVAVNLRVDGKVTGIGYDTMGWVTLSYVDVQMILDTSLLNGSPHITVRSGSVSTSVGSISTDFNGVDGWIINNIVTPLAQGSLKNAVRDMLTSYVSGNFNAALDGVVGGLDISTLGTSFGVPKIDGSGTVTLGFGIGFTTLATTPSRILFGIGTKFTSTVANAYSTLGAPLPPGVNLTDPLVTGPSTVALGAHVGLINQALHALWRANYLTAHLTGAQITSGLPAEVQLDVNTKLPPVAYINTDGTVALQIGALDAVISYPGLPDNLAVTLGLDAHASVTLNGNDLKFGGIVVDQIYVSTESLALTPTQQMTLETVIEGFAQQLADQSLNNALPALPIPSFPLGSLSAYGFSPTAKLGIGTPSLTSAPHHFTLRGQFSVQ